MVVMTMSERFRNMPTDSKNEQRVLMMTVHLVTGGMYVQAVLIGTRMHMVAVVTEIDTGIRIVSLGIKKAYVVTVVGVVTIEETTETIGYQTLMMKGLPQSENELGAIAQLVVNIVTAGVRHVTGVGVLAPA